MHLRNVLLVSTIATSVVPVTRIALAKDTSAATEKTEKTVKLEDIPAPARETILREAKGAKVHRVEMEKDKGKTVYEGVVMQGKEEIGIVVDSEGTLLGKHPETGEKGQH
jgi:uncharacterized membrane protein YkoI